MGKKRKRYIKRFLSTACTWVLARLITNWIIGLIYTLDPGWLIRILLLLIGEAVPPVLALGGLCLQYYTEAKEDGELDQLLGREPVIDEAEIIPEQAPVTDYKEHQPNPAPEPPIETAPPSAPEMPAIEVPESVVEPITKPAASDEAPQTDDPAPGTSAETTLSVDSTTDDATEDEPLDSQTWDPFDCIRDAKIMSHYIVLDIETTGFSRENDRIIEIAAIHYVFGVEAERFHTYINPQMMIPKHITRLTGIRQTDVDTAPLLDDIADDFRAFIRDYPLVGHNIIDFDLPFLASHMTLEEPCLVIDTLDMSRFAFPMLPSHKLSNLNYWFDLDDGASHRADSDAVATNALMWACLYPEKYETLYRKAVRNGIPENKHTHEPKPHHHFHHISTTEIKPSSNHDTKSGPLAGKKIVFTGELSIPRQDAMQMAVDAGAVLRSSVSSKTDILVVGKQDLSVVGSDGMSSKEEKAHELNKSGKGNIQIVSEQDFWAMFIKSPATV